MRTLTQNERRGLWSLLLLILWLGSGCSSLPRPPKPPAAKISSTAGRIEQSGAAEVPAKVNRAETRASLPVPAGSVVTVKAARVEDSPEMADPVAVELSAASVLTVESSAESLAGPKAQAPPVPPSPAEIAKGDGIKWFYAAGVVCGLAAVVAVWKGHPINAAVLVAGAVGLPILGTLAASEWALRLALVVGALSVGLAVAWLVLRRFHPDWIAEQKKKISA